MLSGLPPEAALLLLLLALALDALVGDPAWLWHRRAHPVALTGRAIGWADRRLNRERNSARRRRLAGIGVVLVLVLAGGGLGFLLQWVLMSLPFGWILIAVAASVLIAQKSLADHVVAVADALDRSLDDARQAVGKIVGREPAALDRAAVARAAIESGAENFSDGVVAPAFWFALLGLPGLCIYKAVNTADSMIGHRSPRHRAFGWAAARLDDGLNLVPARLAGVLIALGAPLIGDSFGPAYRVMRADAGKHRSPNAGWPEAAMAGALGLALGGPRRYATGVVDDAWLNEPGREAARSADVRRSVRLLWAAAAAHGLLYAALALVVGELAP